MIDNSPEQEPSLNILNQIPTLDRESIRNVTSRLLGVMTFNNDLFIECAKEYSDIVNDPAQSLEVKAKAREEIHKLRLEVAELTDYDLDRLVQGLSDY